jgi:hypothetical protein
VDGEVKRRKVPKLLQVMLSILLVITEATGCGRKAANFSGLTKESWSRRRLADLKDGNLLGASVRSLQKKVA